MKVEEGKFYNPKHNMVVMFKKGKRRECAVIGKGDVVRLIRINSTFTEVEHIGATLQLPIEQLENQFTEYSKGD